MFQIKGIVNEVYQTQTFSRGFTKREFLLDVRRGEKIERIKFECHRDEIALLDGILPGDLIEIEFYITGKPWNDNYFNNLVCFGIECEKSKEEEEVTTLTEKQQEVVDEDVPF